MSNFLYLDDYSKSSFSETFWARTAAGMLGGTIGGLSLFLILMSYGSKYGCFKILDTIFNGAGYESCGAFGSIAGILAGAVIGVFLLGKVRLINNSWSIGILAGASFLLPFLYAFFTMGAWQADSDLLIVIPVIFFFMAGSLAASVILLAIIKGFTFIIRKYNSDQL
ncbi:MAG: hypothetical protein WCP19_09710 [Chloroflexota bacterium]